MKNTRLAENPNSPFRAGWYRKVVFADFRITTPVGE